MSTNLATRLRQILRDLDWSQADLARAAGASKASVSRWISDGPIRMDPKFAFRLQDKTDFSARWLLLGEGPADIFTVAGRIIRKKELRGRNQNEN